MRNPWHLPFIRADRRPSEGGGAAVALFDSGIDVREGPTKRALGKEKISGRFCGVCAGRDFTSSRLDRPYVDEFGHGTKVASLIASRPPNPALSNSCLGLAPEAGVYNYKIARSDGRIDKDALVGAARLAAQATNPSDEGMPAVRVALLAFDLEAWKRIPNEISEALDTLIDASILPIVAAGDSPRRRDLKQTDVPWKPFADAVVSVAALKESGELTKETNFGKGVHLAAPGHLIPCHTPMARGLAFGTSAAAAIVAAAAVCIAATTHSSTKLRTELLNNVRTDPNVPVEQNRVLSFQ